MVWVTTRRVISFPLKALLNAADQKIDLWPRAANLLSQTIPGASREGSLVGQGGRPTRLNLAALDSIYVGRVR